MFTAFDYINGVIVSPDSQILVVRRAPSNQVHYVDDFKATFQCAMVDGEKEMSCLTEEIDRLFGITVNSDQYLKAISVTRVGSVRKEDCTYKIIIYIIKFIKTITLNVDKNCEMRLLPLRTAVREALHPILMAYDTKNEDMPNYTSTARRVLQEIEKRGGVTKCTTIGS